MEMRFEEIVRSCDLIVVGGGITGAGVLREATRMGLSALLIEQGDFSSGTSSRSSKLVHGGLRYLKQGRFGLTWQSVREREGLLVEAAGLVRPIPFNVPIYSDRKPSRNLMRIALNIYSLMAGERQHSFVKPDRLLPDAPLLRRECLEGGYRYRDAQVDDARLVQRLINESVARGAAALNYTRVESLRRTPAGRVDGVTARDAITGEVAEIEARVVVNATGVWSEGLHPLSRAGFRLRALRGSHLILPARAVPLAGAVSTFHPRDARPIFAIPWEGAVIFGTTDVDHGDDFTRPPVITDEETDYLLEGLEAAFPELRPERLGCLSAISGLRPVLGTGSKDPSRESREHLVHEDRGLVTATGGKLTTFRKMGREALRAARSSLAGAPLKAGRAREPAFVPCGEPSGRAAEIGAEDWARLSGRYGELAGALVEEAAEEDLERIPGTEALWAELPFAARHEQVRHLADLMLRRVRVGLLVPRGGEELLGRVREICERALGWDGERWEREKSDYLAGWARSHAPPERCA
jgi:glycerol-3-phosphate dehydrogenase